MGGAADEGALEWGRSQLQSRALLTPAALGGGVRAGAVPGGPAPHGGEPPALHGAHKYMARRESTTPPQRTAGGEAGTGGNLPTDKGDYYIGLGGMSHEPERRADDELARAQAEVQRLRARLKTLQGKSKVQVLGNRVRDLEEESRVLFDTVQSDTESTAALAATLAAAAARRPPPARRPSGDVGDPAANPVHPTPSGRVTRPRAAKQSAPPSAATRTAGRKTDGPLHGAALTKEWWWPFGNCSRTKRATELIRAM